jgi:hypothetical protein
MALTMAVVRRHEAELNKIVCTTKQPDFSFVSENVTRLLVLFNSA